MLRVRSQHPKHRTIPPIPPTQTIARFTAPSLSQEPIRVIAARNLTQSSPSFSIDNPINLNPKAFLKCANSLLRLSRKLAVNFATIVLGNRQNFLNSSDCFPRTAEFKYRPIHWIFTIKRRQVSGPTMPSGDKKTRN